MNKKMNFRMDIKGLSEDGTFEGILSPYGSIDQGGDLIEPGSYTKTLKDQGNVRPMLWQHKTDEPIGTLELSDRPDGLWAKGKILLELPTGKIAYTLIKAKAIKGLSIGYETVKSTMVKGVRHLKELKLYEGSIVTFPMATDAMITAVKAREDGETKDDFNEELMDIQLLDAGYQMRCALSCALSSLFWNGLTKDEIISGAETIIGQFSEAYTSYLPSYIDMLAEDYGGIEMMSREDIEKKAGASISAASKTTIQSGLDQILAGVNTLSALVAEKAAQSTSSEAAADQEEKHEPVEVDHSALQPLLSELLSLTKPTISLENNNNGN
jgi:HK97 family phage prohead protease